MCVEGWGNNVKISRLIVKGLHGRYDYDVSFNTDLTFLFGANGSGKTTILDILSSIITGELYRLYSYDFISLDLHYTGENDVDDSIRIEFNNTPEEYIIKLTYMGKSCPIEYIDPRNEPGVAISERGRYFRRYPVLSQIKEMFPFIYLPLNRKGSGGRSSATRRTRRETVRRSRYSDEFIYEVDDALADAEAKISYFQHLASQRKRDLNNKFKDDLIKSLLIIEEKNITSTFPNIDPSKVGLLFDGVAQSIKKLGVLTEDEYDKFISDNKVFYDNLSASKSLSKSKDESSKESIERFMNLVLNMYRLQQADDIVKLTNSLQDSIDKEDHKLNSFMETLNNFFGEGEDAVTRKTLEWNAGKVVFRNDQNSDDIDITNLSSGEKQLFIFFAFLLFSLEENQSGILVVDEPELSLHLAWQREYVKRIIGLQSNIQLIFATHSPEIIGQYTDRAVKLRPELTDEGVV